MLTRQKHAGFTLIETLVAIAVLMIAIAGPLTVANKAYRAALDAKNATIATNLATEGMEYLNNLKDNGNSWPPLGSAGSACIGPSSRCGISLSAGGPAITTCADTNPCKLYFSNEKGYSGDAGGSETVFTREFNLTAASIAGAKPAQVQYLATVTVKWTTGTTGNQVQIQQILTNADR